MKVEELSHTMPSEGTPKILCPLTSPSIQSSSSPPPSVPSIKKTIFRKRNIVDETPYTDHDYLSNLANEFKKKKTGKENEEEKFMKIYSDTVEILQNINDNIIQGLNIVASNIQSHNNNVATALNNLAENVQDLTSAVKECTKVLSNIIYTKQLSI